MTYVYVGYPMWVLVTTCEELTLERGEHITLSLDVAKVVALDCCAILVFDVDAEVHGVVLVVSKDVISK